MTIRWLVMEVLSESIDADPSRHDISVPEMRSFVVASEAARGTVVNGEERTASNKRKRDTVVPVDDELRRLLVGGS